MKKIVLSADNNPSIYLVPDVVADNMGNYIERFFEWLNDSENDHGYWVETLDGKGLHFTEQAFVKWVNDFVVETSETAVLIESKDFESLSEEEQVSPYFNF